MPRPKRRGRKALIVLLVLLLVIVGLLVVADRVGASVANDKVAQQVAVQARKNDVKLGQEPTAEITGFPFLTQVAAGKYDKILVHMRDLQAQAYSVPKLDITATGVHAKASDVLNGSGTITADQVDGRATIGWGYLQQTAKDQLKQKIQVDDLTLSGTGGNLTVHLTVPVLSQQVKVVGTAKVTAADDHRSVVVSVKDLKPDGTKLPSYAQQALTSLAQQLTVNVTLPKLPYGLKLYDIQPASDGLQVEARASDVTLAG
ncbi:LmeA family phospholipid-binding protein [Actinocatenispora rupis]|uniref:DUF2993 domain-containing protein n=1 Tax=Actinocatenispora rupis TaxID=519421 RepID=A0A8J3JB55_9ACTN|nr:DUF2993 domain-containing protein [Actinocatenispora rupis]GID15151.1 hypothetical protein Aru02nite_60400 [Actinocatenispora rupis]